MYNNNIRTDSEIHQFINSEFRNDRLRLEWPLALIVFRSLGIFFFFFFFFFNSEKIQFTGIKLTSQRVKVTRLPLSYRGER